MCSHQDRCAEESRAYKGKEVTEYGSVLMVRNNSRDVMEKEPQEDLGSAVWPGEAVPSGPVGENRVQSAS